MYVLEGVCENGWKERTRKMKWKKIERVKDWGEWVYVARELRKQIRIFESVKLKGSPKIVQFERKPSLSLLDILAKLNFTSVARRCSDFHYKLCTHGQQNSHICTHTQPYTLHAINIVKVIICTYKCALAPAFTYSHAYIHVCAYGDGHCKRRRIVGQTMG